MSQQVKTILLTQPRTIYGQVVSQLNSSDWDLMQQDGFFLCNQLVAPSGKDKLFLLIPCSNVALAVISRCARSVTKKEEHEQSITRIPKTREDKGGEGETQKINPSNSKGTDVSKATRIPRQRR
jgi:hypothetical protein